MAPCQQQQQQAAAAPTRGAGQVKLQLLEVVAIHHGRARRTARHGVAQTALQQQGGRQARARMSAWAAAAAAVQAAGAGGGGGRCSGRRRGRRRVVTVLRVGRVGREFRPLTSAVRSILTPRSKLRARRAGDAAGDRGSRRADACTTGEGGRGGGALSFPPVPPVMQRNGGLRRMHVVFSFRS